MCGLWIAICVVLPKNDPAFKADTYMSKHMDSHEPPYGPYKCSESGCEKKLGFASRGGFLRHRREVHNKGSKPRDSLFCPYEDCARSHAKPFVRTENLRAHIRRVHRPNGTSSDKPCGNLSAEARIPINTSLGPHGNHNPATCISHESFLQMEAESLRDRIMKQDRRIEELQRQKMELEARSHGTKPNNLN
ncbi:C2H2 transcription factor [Penicillium citrinum]|uniref:C2H2 transcription factor n=1 Tax=Penicillium citrinum TaxID=5077 RepID=A0A9W9TTC2_PENCI|nr:C2H2 transcription factor [Penicillium citrinum]KAJ5240621.1 C2H2 transcription factor [Penicillium citrinum]